MLLKIYKDFIETTKETEEKIVNFNQLKHIFNLQNKNGIHTLNIDNKILESNVISYPLNYFDFNLYLKQIYKQEIEYKLANYINESYNRLNLIYSYLLKKDFKLHLNNQSITVFLSNLNNSYEKINKISKKLNYVKAHYTYKKENIQELLFNPIKTSITTLNNVFNDLDELYNNKELFNDEFDNDNIKINVCKENKLKRYNTLDIYKDLITYNFDNSLFDTTECNITKSSIIYQMNHKSKIEYEYDIIRTKKVYEKLKVKPKIHLNVIEILKHYCCDRNIPIEIWKVPNNYFCEEVFNTIYNTSEALRELLLSKYFVKFMGFDDNYTINHSLLNSSKNNECNSYSVYFFEYIEGHNLISLLKRKELDIFESSMLFTFLSKEILQGLRDIVLKCNYSITKIIECNVNIFYESKQKRIYFKDLKFGEQRNLMQNSTELLESFLLLNYSIILLEILSVSNDKLCILINKLKNLVNNNNNILGPSLNLQHLLYVENFLNENMENNLYISIILECLHAPYKQQKMFNMLYKKDGFSEDLNNTQNNKEFVNIDNEYNSKYMFDIFQCKSNKSDFIKENYNLDTEGNQNDGILTLNNLLLHPLFSKTKFNYNLISEILNIDQ